MGQKKAKSGGYTLAETLSQPECWAECLRETQQSGVLRAMCERFGQAAEWIFVGCGSSYYLALSAAAAWAALTGLRARAVPASELLIFPNTLTPDVSNCVPVLVSSPVAVTVTK